MDASYVNAFVQGAQRVFANVCNETPSLGKVFVKSAPYSASPVTVSVGVFGDFEGEVVYNMEEGMGCYIASQMMMGMPVPNLNDDMAKSAICEIANIISGNVATIFSRKEILVDIKPPEFKANAESGDFPFAERTSKIVCVPLNFANGSVFEVDVMIP